MLFKKNIFMSIEVNIEDFLLSFQIQELLSVNSIFDNSNLSAKEFTKVMQEAFDNLEKSFQSLDQVKNLTQKQIKEVSSIILNKFVEKFSQMQEIKVLNTLNASLDDDANNNFDKSNKTNSIAKNKKFADNFITSKVDPKVIVKHTKLLSLFLKKDPIELKFQKEPTPQNSNNIKSSASSVKAETVKGLSHNLLLSSKVYKPEIVLKNFEVLIKNLIQRIDSKEFIKNEIQPFGVVGFMESKKNTGLKKLRKKKKNSKGFYRKELDYKKDNHSS